MLHVEKPTHCRTCGGPLGQRWEVLEPILGVLISELVCGHGHGWIGSRWPAGQPGRQQDDDEGGSEMDSAVMETAAGAGTETRTLNERYALVPLTQLQESRYNPRQHFDPVKLAELADSIRQKGIVEPLVVRDSEVIEPRFEIIAGARRFRASQLAGLAAVPCIVRDYSDEDVLEIFVVENMQRDDLSPLEQARGFKQLLTTNADRFSVATIASKVGMSPAWVWDRLKLLDLVPEAQELLESGRISVGHAIVLARLKSADQERAIEPDGGGLWQDAGETLDLDEASYDVVLWIGAQELIAGLLYLWTGEPWKALAWGSYGLACVGLAMAGK